MLPHPEPTPTPRAVPVLLAGSSWLPWLCHPSPWGAPFKGLPGPPSTRTLHHTCLLHVQCVLNSSDTGLEVPSVVKPEHGWLCMSPSLSESLSMARAGVSCHDCGDSPSRPRFPIFPPQSHKEQFFSQSCNCPSRSLPYLVGWLLGFLASHGYLA